MYFPGLFVIFFFSFIEVGVLNWVFFLAGGLMGFGACGRFKVGALRHKKKNKSGTETLSRTDHDILL